MKACLHKDLGANFHSSIILNRQKPEATHSPSEGLGANRACAATQRMLFRIRESKHRPTCYNTGGTQTCLAEGRKPDIKHCKLYDSVYMQRPGKGLCRDRGRWWSPGMAGEQGVRRQRTTLDLWRITESFTVVTFTVCELHLDRAVRKTQCEHSRETSWETGEPSQEGHSWEKHTGRATEGKACQSP